jgi:hypothetical protein
MFHFTGCAPHAEMTCSIVVGISGLSALDLDRANEQAAVVRGDLSWLTGGASTRRDPPANRVEVGEQELDDVEHVNRVERTLDDAGHCLGQFGVLRDLVRRRRAC